MAPSTKTCVAIVLLQATFGCREAFGFGPAVSRAFRTHPTCRIADTPSESFFSSRLFGQAEAEESESEEPNQVDKSKQLRPFRDASAANPPTDSWSRFSTDKDLDSLRSDLDNLRENLRWAEATEDHELVKDLKTAIANGERLDPDAVYAKALQVIADTKVSKDLSDMQKAETIDLWQNRAQSARAVLPQFQLEGLWIGNYGSHGDELINVTYVEDTLIAYKTTGDANVPRGEVSFTVDLAPKADGSALEPLKLSFDKARVPARKQPRYAGQGQVAKRGFLEPEFVDGHLVLFERHFSFVWLPKSHHVLFRRPSLNQILSMLRDTLSHEDELSNMREHLNRCYDLDMVYQIPMEPADDIRGFQKDEPFRRISLRDELESMAVKDTINDNKGIRFAFWNMYKYIDSAFRDDKSEANKSDNNGPDALYEGDGI